MATPSTIPQERTSAPGGRTLHRLAGRDDLRGFANLFANENHGWWRTRAWLIQLAVWLGIINGLIALVTYGETQDASGAMPPLLETLIQVFFKAGGPAIAVGAVIAAQGAVVGEKQLGTAAWIMSKPAGRSAFLLSKLAAYLLVFVGLAIAVPSVVFFGQTRFAAGQMPALLPFLAAQGVMLLHLLFYLALTLLLGAFASSRGPVAGGALGFLFAGMLLPSFVPQVAVVFPWQLGDIATGLTLGTRLPATWPIPVLATAGWTLLFIAAALWRFAREEF
jgi:ABC-2 type transport system permease protein